MHCDIYFERLIYFLHKTKMKLMISILLSLVTSTTFFFFKCEEKVEVLNSEPENFKKEEIQLLRKDVSFTFFFLKF